MTLKEFEDRLKELVKEATPKDYLEKLGQSLRDRIKTRTRLGRGVESRGEKATDLKALSPTYIKERERLKSKGALSSETSPKGIRGKSNLTKTGKMLDSLSYSVNGNEVEIFVKGSEEQSKVKANADQGRTFLNFSDLDEKYIRDEITNRIKKLIQTKFK